MGSRALDQSPRATPVKDPSGTRERILEVALQEFSAKGLSGARVDEIAELTQTSKRMIYYYFSSKEELYRAVLERAYIGIHQSEAHVDTAHMPPEKALASIIRLSFDYHRQHEAFVRLVMNENMHYAEHIRQIPTITPSNVHILKTLEEIISRGVEVGVFRSGIDIIQLHMTISGFGFHFTSNRHTFSYVFDCDMSTPAAAAARKDVAVETVLAWCRPLPPSDEIAEVAPIAAPGRKAKSVGRRKP